MNIVHRSDGSWDGTFTDSTNEQASCTMIIVPPLKGIKKSRSVQFQEYQSPRVEEVSDSDEGEDEEEN